MSEPSLDFLLRRAQMFADRAQEAIGRAMLQAEPSRRVAIQQAADRAGQVAETARSERARTPPKGDKS